LEASRAAPGSSASTPSAVYRGARVAVFGATGFIGGWVTRALDAVGATLCLVVRDAGAATALAGRLSRPPVIARADLLRPGEVALVLREVRPHVVFNLAGYGVDREERDPRVAAAINGVLPGAIVEVLAEVADTSWPGQALVHAGSALEYGTAQGDLREETPVRPTTLYGRSKSTGTAAVAERCPALGVRGLTARLFTVYGAGEHPGRLLPTLLEAARTGCPVPLSSGDQRRDFTYVEEVAEGLIRLGLSAAPPGATVNLASGRLVAVRDFALTAARVLGIPPEALRFGALASRPEEMEHDPVNVSRLLELTGGWAPGMDVAEGVRRAREHADRGGPAPRSAGDRRRQRHG
jgi:nucleoside-diphosphate-sugar epimerase